MPKKGIQEVKIEIYISSRIFDQWDYYQNYNTTSNRGGGYD